jgi:copper chaperone CopZ
MGQYTSASRETELFNEFMCVLQSKWQYIKKHDFIDIFERILPQRIFDYGINKILYRARRMSDPEYGSASERNDSVFRGFDQKDSFVPPANAVKASRANSSGVTCLYAAETVETAICEVRPYKESFVSVADIKLKKALKLVDLVNPITNIGKYNVDDLSWFEAIMKYFSIPCEDYESGDCLLTQFLSDFMREIGKCDGLRYRSSLDDKGVNICVFNCSYDNYDICEPTTSSIYIANNIEVSFEPYLMSKTALNKS